MRQHTVGTNSAALLSSAPRHQGRLRTGDSISMASIDRLRRPHVNPRGRRLQERIVARSAIGRSNCHATNDVLEPHL